MISPAPRTGADVSCEPEGSQVGWGMAISCKDSNGTLICWAGDLPWKQRPEGRPRGLVIRAGITFEIWDQLKIPTSAPQERERGYRGEGTLRACCKIASLVIF